MNKRKLTQKDWREIAGAKAIEASKLQTIVDGHEKALRAIVGASMMTRGAAVKAARRWLEAVDKVRNGG